MTAVKDTSSSSAFALLLLLVIGLLLLLLPLFCTAAYPIRQPQDSSYRYLPLPYGVFGPESFAFDCNGEGPYVSVSDGRIFKWEGIRSVWREFAFVAPDRRTRAMCLGNQNPELEVRCGRPLGVKFDNRTCELYIADAYFGLMKVGKNGGQAVPVASSLDGVNFLFTNNMDIHPDTGEVYFTDSSTRFTRKDNLLVTLTSDGTGRFMKYDPASGEVIVLLRGLKFANGVVLSEECTFVLVAETSAARVLRYWLRGPKANTTEIFTQLPGGPDNIKRSSSGGFWFALNNGKSTFSDTGEIITGEIITGDHVDKNGKIIEGLRGNGVLQSVSEVYERNGAFWVGSIVTPFTTSFQGQFYL